MRRNSVVLAQDGTGARSARTHGSIVGGRTHRAKCASAARPAGAAARPRSAAAVVPRSRPGNGSTLGPTRPDHLGGWKLITTGSSSMAPPPRAQPGSQQECRRSWLTASPATIR